MHLHIFCELKFYVSAHYLWRICISFAPKFNWLDIRFYTFCLQFLHEFVNTCMIFTLWLPNFAKSGRFWAEEKNLRNFGAKIYQFFVYFAKIFGFASISCHFLYLQHFCTKTWFCRIFGLFAVSKVFLCSIGEILMSLFFFCLYLQYFCTKLHILCLLK